MVKKQSTKKNSGANKKRITATQHGEQTRPNIPTAQMEALVADEESHPVSAEYSRNKDLDPQLMWHGKDDENAERLRVAAVPIYVQEKIKPLAIIEDLRRQTAADRMAQGHVSGDLFGDFNGLPENARVEFYKHAHKWTNRMILGDSLLVMTSLAHKERLKGKVQCIYMDPPYGIKFASNWQPSTKSTAVSEKDETHEPEMIQAFRDTWKNGVHSYLSYLRDRLIVSRDLLTESGSVFVQISDKNVHIVRNLMDEIFGDKQFVGQIILRTRNTSTKKYLASLNDYIIWYCKDIDSLKFRRIFNEKTLDTRRFGFINTENESAQRYRSIPLASTSGGATSNKPFSYCGKEYLPPMSRGWRCTMSGLERLAKASRIILQTSTVSYKYFYSDFLFSVIGNIWEEHLFEANKIYAVQTAKKAIQRCILMATDPGDLVYDPTCGSGTTAFVAEQWGRRWITTDTSRVALTLARARIMGANYPHYLLQDSAEGAAKEAEISGQPTAQTTFSNDVRHGFVYERAPHITLGDIANNKEIDTIWEKWQKTLSPLREKLNKLAGESWQEWEIPHEPAQEWSKEIKQTHADWQKSRRSRQQEIDQSIAQNAKSEYLVDRPYQANNAVRVSGAFTMESLSPHRIVPPESLPTDAGMTQPKKASPKSERENEARFLDVVRENLQQAGVSNTRQGEKLEFVEIDVWGGGRHIQFAGKYEEKGKEKKAAICIGPEYGTVSRQLLRQAAQEAADMFDMLVVLGFAFEAFADDDLVHVGRLPVLRARMHNDLHMADRLSAGNKKEMVNLFVSFGEPDIQLRASAAGDEMYEVEILGVDIFNPRTGDVRASDAADIACWMIDTDYNEESFFVRHAYFCGGGKDPYKSLKTALQADINKEAWDSLHRTTSRPFPKPKTGYIAVKAINHYGDEVIKVLDIKEAQEC